MSLMELLRRPEEVSPLAQPWRARGSCRGIDPAIFYPPEDDDVMADAAKSICAGCSVRQACLQFALNQREKHGVWGGMTERERRRVLRQRRKSA